jgi:hypothetical protein
MKRFENIYIIAVILLFLMIAYTYLLDNVASYIIYLVVGIICGIFLKLDKCLIISTFLLYVIIAIVAQLADAEWFYHDMPEKITAFYFLISLARSFLLIVPLCCGAGISWFIDYHRRKGTT